MEANASQFWNSVALIVAILGRTTDTNFLQFTNELAPIAVTVLGMVMEAISTHPLNTSVPIVVTDEGIVMETNLLQFRNMLLLMLPSLVESVTFSNLIQSRKVSAPMVVTEFGMAMDVKLLHPWNTTELKVKAGRVDVDWNVTEANEEQFKNAPLPKKVTVDGIVMEANFMQPLKEP